MRLRATLVFFFATGAAQAQVSESEAREEIARMCAGPTVHTLDVPRVPGSAGPTHSYSYQLLVRDPNAPTIVVLPGGPGASSIVAPDADYGQEALAVYPRQVNLLLTDPRTAGCNVGTTEVYPDEELSTHAIAADVVEAIRHAKLENYSLNGESYGTQLATVVAARIEQSGLPKPRAVVLSGVVGKGGPETAVFRGLETEWNRLLATLDPATIARLKSSDGLPFPHDRWTRFIEGGLYRGRSLVDGRVRHLLREAFALATDPSPDALIRLKELVTPPPIMADPLFFTFSERLYDALSCREISNVEFEWSLDGITPIKKPSTNCTGGHTLDRPYDPADYKFSAPIFYFQGTHDPATPLAGARYHHDVHSTNERVFVTFPESGHAMVNRALNDCIDPVWAAIFDLRPLAPVLATCALPTEIVP